MRVLLFLGISWILGSFNLRSQDTLSVPEMLLLDGIPSMERSLASDLSPFMQTRSASLVGWMPQGKGVLIRTRFSDTDQFHIVGEAGAYRKQITFFEEPVFEGAVNHAPGRQGFLFLKDTGGSEFFQLFYLEFKTGLSRMLTDGKSRNGMGIWSPSGEKMVYSSTQKNGRDYALYLQRLDARYPKEIILDREGLWQPLDWSPKESQMTVRNYVSVNESYLYVLDLESGQTNLVAVGPEKASYDGGIWSKDGSIIYLISDYGFEYKTLMAYYPLEDRFRVLTDRIAGDLSDLKLSPDGKNLSFLVNDQGWSRLFVLDTQTEKYFQIQGIPDGVISDLDWHPDGIQIGFTLKLPHQASDCYAVDVRNFRMERWTYGEMGGLNPEDMVQPQIIRYPSFDKVHAEPRQIPAFFYKPKNAIGPYPVVIQIHGGPEAQFRPEFNPFVQYLCTKMGVAVLAPNVRGSSGYGKTYLQLDNGLKREDAVKDLGALLDWIDNQPGLDAGRIAVMGGSYGGYMVLAALAHFPGRIRCGIDVVGISNFVTFLQNTQAYRQDLRRAEYGDERDPAMYDFLWSISPNQQVEKIIAPIFITQGQNDPRVPASESEQMVAALRQNKREVWYLLAKDEGHGFKKKRNRDYFNTACAQFLKQYLLGF